MAELTQARLKELLNYDSETGAFHRRTGPRAGVKLGSTSTGGYIRIVIDQRGYAAHRLAWLYVYGTFPKEFLDHKNGCRSDNRLSNLREATASQNQGNYRLPKHNTSGFKGVTRQPDMKKWRAFITLNGGTKHLGYFHTKEEAHAAYLAEASKRFGEFARSK